MKKIILPTILGFLIIFQSAFITWGNPATWFNNWNFFNRSENDVEVLKNKIQELENRLESSTTTPDAKNTFPAAEIKKPNPIVNNSSNYKSGPEKIVTPEVKIEAPVPDPTPSDITFNVTRITQTIFEETPTEYGYGGFEISVEVFANGGDVFIPMTTNDSTNGITGFVYSIKGDEFRGEQDSEISCGRRIDGYCKINDGSSSIITTTVWLTPNQSGNYGVRFDKVRAKIGTNGTLQSYELGKETEHIYISY